MMLKTMRNYGPQLPCCEMPLNSTENKQRKVGAVGLKHPWQQPQPPKDTLSLRTNSKKALKVNGWKLEDENSFLGQKAYFERLLWVSGRVIVRRFFCRYPPYTTCNKPRWQPVQQTNLKLPKNSNRHAPGKSIMFNLYSLVNQHRLFSNCENNPYLLSLKGLSWRIYLVSMDSNSNLRSHIPPNGKRKIIDSKVLGGVSSQEGITSIYSL